MKTKAIRNLQYAKIKDRPLLLSHCQSPIAYCLLLIACCLLPIISSAQSKFMFGQYYSFGASSMYGNKMTMAGNAMTSGAPMIEYGLKLSGGTGLRSEYLLNEKIGITLNVGYTQRGAKFDMDMADYSPRYRFSYIDIMLGAKYRTKELIGKSKLFFSLGGSQHTLINAYRVNSYNAVNIMDDMQMMDWGAFAGVGIDMPVFSKDILQIQLLANSGFKSVFGGVMEKNGIQGKNILYGLQVSYLLGFKKKGGEIK